MCSLDNLLIYLKMASKNTQQCGYGGCKTCADMDASDTLTSSVTKKAYDISVQNVDCNSSIVIYLITCGLCSVQYVGRTESPHQKLKQRHNGHHQEWRNNKNPLGRHFYSCVGPNVLPGMMKIQVSLSEIMQLLVVHFVLFFRLLISVTAMGA
jgi:hypothetical protein